ncbi:hypothetical protein L6452_36334 [Arctium lappa]|uniref:Uncharacterized protein n=1 Tax=Arctium lappa TaxID=4217 RepID=A0ACB8Y9L0_ARCLA|nr:hypothetical protein L6452_36334 [Arctium lappa]
MFDTSSNSKTIYTSPTSLNKPEQRFTQPLTCFSGPTFGTVDASLHKLVERVDSLAASINNNTTPVNNAGENLKNLSTTISTKANAFKLNSLQTEVNTLKENVANNSLQLQFLNGHVDHHTSEVKILGGKVDGLNRLSPAKSIETSATSLASSSFLRRLSGVFPSPAIIRCVPFSGD